MAWRHNSSFFGLKSSQTKLKYRKLTAFAGLNEIANSIFAHSVQPEKWNAFESPPKIDFVDASSFSFFSSSSWKEHKEGKSSGNCALHPIPFSQAYFWTLCTKHCTPNKAHMQNGTWEFQDGPRMVILPAVHEKLERSILKNWLVMARARLRLVLIKAREKCQKLEFGLIAKFQGSEKLELKTFGTSPTKSLNKAWALLDQSSGSAWKIYVFLTAKLGWLAHILKKLELARLKNSRLMPSLISTS